MGATKKIRTFILTVENFSKSYFRKYPNYWKSKIPEISEIIILRNLSKIFEKFSIVKINVRIFFVAPNILFSLYIIWF